MHEAQRPDIWHGVAVVDVSGRFVLCRYCGREMVMGGGCTYLTYTTQSGAGAQRIPHLDQDGANCHDCNVGIDMWAIHGVTTSEAVVKIWRGALAIQDELK